MGEDEGSIIRRKGSGLSENRLRQTCNRPAPLVLNGGLFAGCNRDKDHDGYHEFTVRWPQ